MEVQTAGSSSFFFFFSSSSYLLRGLSGAPSPLLPSKATESKVIHFHVVIPPYVGEDYKFLTCIFCVDTSIVGLH